jgi:hypothetical protein
VLTRASRVDAKRGLLIQRFAAAYYKVEAFGCVSIEMIESLTLGLRVREVALLLLLSEAQVRRLLQRGTLIYAAAPHLVDVESVRRLFPDDATREVREQVLHRLLTGQVKAPKLSSRYERPSIYQLVAASLQASLPLEWLNRK